MIRIYRSDPPTRLISKDAAKARNAAAAFFNMPASKRAQRYFEFDPLYRDVEVAAQLSVAFAGKCAFCETSLNDTQRETLHFRPMSGTVDARGRYYGDHYWWLAFEWLNLYLACVDCYRMKGSRFPIAGKRARVETPYNALASEKPMLVDPCAEEPSQFLLFTTEGSVGARTDRGHATIEILGLNRHDLVERRRRCARMCMTLLDDVSNALQRGDSDTAQLTIAGLVSPDLEFSALRQQLVANWASDLPRRAIDALRSTRQEVTYEAVDRNEEAAIVETTRRFQRSVDGVVITPNSSTAQRAYYFARARYIERVEIESFRGLSNVAINVRPAESDSAPWTVLLGENATGKSSILQAICLALMSPSNRDRLPIDAREFVQNGASRATVRVYLAGSSRPVELIIHGGSRARFESEAENQQQLLLAYGSTRLLPKRSVARKSTRSAVTRVRNLFDPFAPLLDAEHWLIELPVSQFDIAVRTIQLLLGLTSDGYMIRDRSSIRVRTPGGTVTLRQLSDGYQSVVAAACDIMSVLFTYWADVSIAEAIVLLDEIEAHLHPRWKLSIISAFRRSFPRLQFIVTTHDPLCLRGVDTSEIVVLRRIREAIKPLTELPSSRLLRIDQMLTSDLFGMHSTFDMLTETSFSRYYELLGQRHRNPREVLELEHLRELVFAKAPLGDVPRERVVMQLIDEYLAQARQTVDADEMERLYNAARDSVLAVWNDILESEAT